MPFSVMGSSQRFGKTGGPFYQSAAVETARRIAFYAIFNFLKQFPTLYA
jgi:hypothetical protein